MQKAYSKELYTDNVERTTYDRDYMKTIDSIHKRDGQ